MSSPLSSWVSWASPQSFWVCFLSAKQNDACSVGALDKGLGRSGMLSTRSFLPLSPSPTAPQAPLCDWRWTEVSLLSQRSQTGQWFPQRIFYYKPHYEDTLYIPIQFLSAPFSLSLTHTPLKQKFHNKLYITAHNSVYCIIHGIIIILIFHFWRHNLCPVKVIPFRYTVIWFFYNLYTVFWLPPQDLEYFYHSKIPPHTSL